MRTAEDLALLLHDPATGKGLVDSTSLPRALAGAVVLELVLTGRAHLVEGRWRTRLVVDDRRSGGDRVIDPVLDLALDRLPDEATPKSAVEKLHRRVRDPLMAGLVHDGVVRVQERSFLGLPLTPRWPAGDTTRRDAALARLRAVLVDGATPTPEDASLVALVRAVKAEHRLLDAPRRQLRARSREIAEGAWAGEAVRKAVADIHAAVAATAAVGATTGSG